MLDKRIINKVAKECLELSLFEGKFKYLFQHSLDQKRYYDILLNLYFNENGIIQASSGSYIEYINGEKMSNVKLEVKDINKLINQLNNGTI